MNMISGAVSLVGRDNMMWFLVGILLYRPSLQPSKIAIEADDVLVTKSTRIAILR